MKRYEALLERRNALADELNTVRDQVRSHLDREDDPSEDEVAEFRSKLERGNVIPDELAQLDVEIAQVRAVVEAPAAAHERVGLTLHQPTREDPFAPGMAFRSPREVIDTATRALEGGGVVELADEYRASALRVMQTTSGSSADVARRFILTGSQDYRSAFSKIMAAEVRGQRAYLSDAEGRAVEEARAASLSDAAGGYAVPFTLDPTIILTGAHDGMGNPWRSLATVKQTTTDSWNGVTSAGVAASWDGEAAEVSDDAPTLDTLAIPVHKAQAFIPFSIEVSQDWAGMESDFRMMLAVAKDDLERAAFASSSAPSNSPTGLVYSLVGTVSEINAAGEAVALADLFSLINALPARYRSRATWLGHIATANNIRQFDTNGGAALWVQLGADIPPNLLGRPFVEEPLMDGTINAAATANNYVLVFGDLSNYYIVDRVGLSVELVPHLFHTSNNRPSGQRGLYAYWRVGAKVADINAFRLLDVATTA
jgi:HK97 family phage major capsid protein